jgi:hypothetical protein
MIDVKKTILQLDREKIVLDELSIVDPIKSDDPATVIAAGGRDELDIGYSLPLIKINAYIVKQIDFFKLDLSGKIPELIFRFTTEDELFLYTSYPKDGDLVCLYLKSNSKVYKPIRMDLLVTEVMNNFLSTSSGDSIKRQRANNSGASFTIKAQMRIPGLFQHVSKSFNGKSSFEVLREIAKDLELGFASNEKGTDDKMNWICPNMTYYKFIEDVCSSSWNGEEEFFDWWIDQYYILNFINLKKQILEEGQNNENVLASIGIERGLIGGLDSTTEPGEMEVPLFFTNDTFYMNYPFFVNAYSVKNNAGYIVNNFGYSRDLEFYDTKLVSDKPLNKFVTYNTEYVTQKKLGPDSVLFKGRANEDVYKKETKKTWLGTIYGENQHKNLYQAKIQNKINKYENFKVYLETQMYSYIPWVYRGQNVPTQIVHTEATAAAVASQESKELPQSDPGAYEAGKKVRNKFLSGIYMVMGSYIEYIDGNIRQSFLLGKREWALNPGRGSDPEPKVSK